MKAICMRMSSYVVCLLFSQFTLAQADAQDAYNLVDTRIHSLLSRIETLKGTTQSTLAERQGAVAHELSDFIDFDRIARRVMAKYYKSATSEQRSLFNQVFKDTLLKTYAHGLWEFEDYKVQLLPLRSGEQNIRNTQVMFEVITASGQVFPVTQSLFYHPKMKRWMVQNVIINGVNIGQLFRDQFARLVTENNGDIDLAIYAWSNEVSDQKTKEGPDEASAG